MTTVEIEKLIELTTELKRLRVLKTDLEDKKKSLLVGLKDLVSKESSLEVDIIDLLGGINGIKLPNKTQVSVQETKTLKLIKGTKVETLPSEYTKLTLDLAEVKKAYKENPFLVEFMQEISKTKIKLK
jgi:hypothetical protein